VKKHGGPGRVKIGSGKIKELKSSDFQQQRQEGVEGKMAE